MFDEVKAADIERHGELLKFQEDMENFAKKTGIFVKVERVSELQPPKGVLYVGNKLLGLISKKDDKWSFIPNTEIKIRLNVKAGTFSAANLVYVLKHLADKVNNEKPLTLLPGGRGKDYKTNALKRALLKSKFRLIK